MLGINRGNIIWLPLRHLKATNSPRPINGRMWLNVLQWSNQQSGEHQKTDSCSTKLYWLIQTLVHSEHSMLSSFKEIDEDF